MNRRSFLKKLAAGSVAISAYGPLTQIAQGTGTPRPRRHLINIIKGGGFDTFWHHNSMAPSQLQSSAHPAIEQGTTTPGNPASRNIQRIGAGATDYLTIREAEDSARFYASGGRTHYFGSSFQQLFRNTRLDNGNPLLSKMQVWKGMASSCRHELDNPILLHGVGSSYALSFSALISERLAKDSARTLHYAVLHDNPSQAFLNFALNTGYQSPSCIPGVAGLTNLTGTDPNDFTSVTRRELVATTIKNLSGAIFSNRFKLRSTLSSLNVFNNSFNASQVVAGSHLDQDVELLYARNRFRNQIYLEAARFFGVSNSSGPIYDALIPLAAQDGMGSGQSYIDMMRGGYNYAVANPVPDLTSYRTKKTLGQDVSVEEIALRTQLRSNINNSSLQSFYPDLIDRFAIAAYLVRQNLSAVVDFREGAGMGVIDDAHHNVLPGLAKEMVFFIGFQELMLYLDEYKNANPGETLLDATHIVMHTEMDRTAYVDNNSLSAYSGTNHALSSTSVLQAGYGINGGKIIGDNHKGPNDANQFSGQFTSALPIDVGTGLPNERGKMVSIKALAPTMLSMFDTALPFNQISDEDAIAAVIKKNMG